MNKVQRTMLSAYLTMKNKFDDFMKQEDGMETVQAIILVVVGIVIVGALLAVIGDEENGIIGDIKDQLEGIIGQGDKYKKGDND